MDESTRSLMTGLPYQPEPPGPPPRPGFGFLLGGTTLGIFFGCLLLCAGATPPDLILMVLSICGAITGGFLEAFWPKQWPAPKPSRGKRSKQKSAGVHECRRCGEVFEPDPIVCPMCGDSENHHRPHENR